MNTELVFGSLHSTMTGQNEQDRNSTGAVQYAGTGMNSWACLQSDKGTNRVQGLAFGTNVHVGSDGYEMFKTKGFGDFNVVRLRIGNAWSEKLIS